MDIYLFLIFCYVLATSDNLILIILMLSVVLINTFKYWNEVC